MNCCDRCAFCVTGVYAIVDLCGQVSQVTIGASTGHLVTSSHTDNNQLTANSHTVQHTSTMSLSLQPGRSLVVFTNIW